MATATEPQDNQPVESAYVLHRRFDRMGRLVGDEAMKKLQSAHIYVIGLGGVGSWTAESLIRSGVGRLTVVDFDDICITNTNRQLHTLQGLIGKKKAEVLGERLRKINPQAQINVKVQFYNAETQAEIFTVQPDYVVDAIDNLTAKAQLLSYCRAQGIPVITSTGASARLDPLRIQITDLSKSHTDPMAQQLRKILRSRYEFPAETEFGISCIFSDETPILPVDLAYDQGDGFKCVCPQGENGMHSCDRRNVIYGNASFVTGAFGLAAASWVVRQIVRGS